MCQLSQGGRIIKRIIKHMSVSNPATCGGSSCQLYEMFWQQCMMKPRSEST